MENYQDLISKANSAIMEFGPQVLLAFIVLIYCLPKAKPPSSPMEPFQMATSPTILQKARYGWI